MDEESDVGNTSTDLNLDVESQQSLTGSTSADVKKNYARPFLCTYCEKRFTTITKLRAHTRIHTVEQPYCCSYCKKPFRTKTVLKLHLQLHTGKRYKCTECEMRFTQVQKLKIHLRTHSGDRPFQCSKCSKSFISKPNLIKHVNKECLPSQYNGKQNNNKGNTSCYICDICHKNFTEKYYLSDHIQSVHLKVKSFPCKICGLVSSTSSNRRKHEKLHDNKFSFVCHECNKSFKEKGGLKAHITSVHSETKPFICDLCNNSFKLLSYLKTHHEVHHAEKNPNRYVCKICKMGFYRLVYLKRHQQTHTDSDKIFTCNDCGLKCRSKTDMERHVVTHIGGGDKPFKCDVCGMAFSRRTKMLRHQLVHSDEKPYKCDLCSKAYKDSSSLKIHKGSVHLKRKFICNTCGFKSTNESSFKRHIRHQMCKI